jgi:hypothetical protein
VGVDRSIYAGLEFSNEGRDEGKGEKVKREKGRVESRGGVMLAAGVGRGDSIHRGHRLEGPQRAERKNAAVPRKQTTEVHGTVQSRRGDGPADRRQDSRRDLPGAEHLQHRWEQELLERLPGV